MKMTKKIFLVAFILYDSTKFIAGLYLADASN